MDVIRAFIAIELKPEIRLQLGQLIQNFKLLRTDAVRWVAVENIHLTLKFLGDTNRSDLDKLSKILLSRSAEFSPFTFQVSGIGAFPNNRKPRVVWVGLQAPAALHALQGTVEDATTQIGIPVEERKFSPHLTLGRVRNDASPADLQTLSSALTSMQASDLGSMTAVSFTLFHSDLRPQGPLYTPLAHFPLAGPGK
ncbi:MAG: RNA 2',3'-cyclic phosphodiesterase [Bellilinea sp.]